jgi:hypothetical protein
VGWARIGAGSHNCGWEIAFDGLAASCVGYLISSLIGLGASGLRLGSD